MTFSEADARSRHRLKQRLGDLSDEWRASPLTYLVVASSLCAAGLLVWQSTRQGPASSIVDGALITIFMLDFVALCGFLADLFNALTGTGRTQPEPAPPPMAQQAREVADLAGAAIGTVAGIPVVIVAILAWLAVVVFVVGGAVGLLMIGWGALAG